MKTLISILILLLLINLTGYSQEIIDISLRKEAEHSIRFGLKWLERHQEEDGSWIHYPAVTALVVTAFLKSAQGYSEINSITVARGVEFILRCQQEDGGFYIDDLAGYNTAICIMALVATNNPDYDDEIRRARDFLLSLQFDETSGIERNNINYGGIGYKDKERPDLSNLQWAIEALKESEKYRKVGEENGKPHQHSGTGKSVAVASSKELFWDRAIIFLQRCQNLKTSNDQEWAGDDGGFIYSPSESKAGNYTSYGSMTYAGMKSFIYAGVDNKDKRVQAAYNWIRKNFTVEKNPQLGEQGLFYYYHTMAKALTAYGEDFIVDTTGTKRNWRKELLEKLISLQDGEGFWQNKNNRWWENKKELVTAYTILAMEHVLNSK
ncbi:MAG: hypothetical protein IGBAC_1443 [Ignavibacteriae bacterium]|nr:MAG: hypothetical protein IGBAC_1443 [Ignavibacteriota bacterium]